VVKLATYIVDPEFEKLAVLGAVLERTWGRGLPAQSLIGVTALALPEMMFEVDAIAVRPSVER